LDQIPVSYLAWVLENCSNASPVLRLAIWKVLDSCPDDGPAARPEAPANWAEVVTQWYRQMALRYHPDRGGTDAEMKVVNDAYERLQKLLSA
jgi:hypothetical protein